MPQDTQIFVGDNRDGSSDYRIPGNAEIRVKAVNATFADNGASVDWLPAVVMFSDSGSVISRALLPDVKVTAGDDAEVSWFPGVKPGGGAAPATSVAFARAWNDHFSGDPFQNIPAGTADNGSFAHTETTDASIISFGTIIHTNDTVTLHGHGAYLLSVGTSWETIDPLLVSTIFATGVTRNAMIHTPFAPNQTPLFADGIGSATTMDFTVAHVTGVAHSNTISHSNNTGVDRVVEQCYFTITYLGTG